MIPERWRDVVTRLANVRAYGAHIDVDEIADAYDEAHQAYIKYYDVWATVDDGGDGILREGVATPSAIGDFESFVQVLADDYQYCVRTWGIESAASELTQSACIEDPGYVVPSRSRQLPHWSKEGF